MEYEDKLYDKFEEGCDSAWNDILNHKSLSVKRFIEDYQFERLKKYANDLEEFIYLAEMAWGCDLDEQQAEMLFLGEEAWVEKMRCLDLDMGYCEIA